MKNSVCPTANDIRRPIFFPKAEFFRSFRIVDSTHDMIIVKWHLLSFRKPNLSEYLPNVPKCGFRKCGFRSVDWTHDMTIVKWALSANFTLWQMRHRFRSTKNGSMTIQRYSMLRHHIQGLWTSTVPIKKPRARLIYITIRVNQI